MHTEEKLIDKVRCCCAVLCCTVPCRAAGHGKGARRGQVRAGEGGGGEGEGCGCRWRSEKKGPPSLQPGKRAKQVESVRQVIRTFGSRSRSKSSDQRRSETTGEGRISREGPSSSWQPGQRGILAVP